jgi:hypothetical protein
LHLFVLAAGKDLPVLPLSIQSLVETLSLQISQFTVVTPQINSTDIKKSLVELFPQLDLEFETDESVLGVFGYERDDFPNNHSVMQVLKLLCTLISKEPIVLLVDGDTIFLKSRIWSSENKSLIIIPPEYIRHHVNFVKNRFPCVEHQSLGYTTQSQILERQTLDKLILSVGSIHKLVSHFIDSMKNSENPYVNEFPAEWQLYGDWAYGTFLERLYPAAYSNIILHRSAVLQSMGIQWTQTLLLETLHHLKREYPSKGTISLHAWYSGIES